MPPAKLVFGEAILREMRDRYLRGETVKNFCREYGCCETIARRAMGPRRLSREERFWLRVDRRAYSPGGCWPWTGSRNSWGYGNATSRVEGTPQGAHRRAWIYAYGPIAPGLLVCHRCDNPPCCNPAHLFTGDHQANMRDMVRKGRHGRFKGEEHVGAQLTEAAVREIRRRRAEEGETLQQIGDRFGVSQPTVWRICRREAWSHVA